MHICVGERGALCLRPLSPQGMDQDRWRLEKFRGIPCRLRGELWEVNGCDEGTAETLRSLLVAVGRTKCSHSEEENLGRGWEEGLGGLRNLGAGRAWSEEVDSTSAGRCSPVSSVIGGIWAVLGMCQWSGPHLKVHLQGGDTFWIRKGPLSLLSLRSE